MYNLIPAAIVIAILAFIAFGMNKAGYFDRFKSKK